MNPTESPSRHFPSLLFNGMLLVVIAGAAWQFLHWGDGSKQVSPDSSPAPRPPEVVRQDLFRSDATPLERNRAVDAWVELGAEGIPHLMDALEADEPIVRRYTANALARIGRDAQAAVPMLRQRLHDDDVDVRYAAVMALSSVDPQLEMNVPVLVELIQNEDEGLAHVAVEALVQTGVACIPAVCDALTDAKPPLRRRCLFVLQHVGDSEPQAIEALRALTKDTEPDIAYNAFQILECWDVLTFEELLAGLRFDDFTMTSKIMYELSDLGTELKTGAPALIELSRDPRHGLQSNSVGRVLELLALAGPAASAAVPDVQAIVQDEESRVHDIAVQCLARIATADSDVVPYLRDKILGNEPWVAQNAGKALREYKPEAARALVPKLIDALRDGNAAAVGALRGIGPEAEMAVPALLEVLADPDSPLAPYAISALGSIGPAAESAIPRFVELLDYEFADGKNTEYVLFALIHFGPEAEVAVPQLMTMIEEARAVGFQGPPGREIDFSARDYVARDAVRTLGHMGQAARPAVPILLELVQDPVVSHKALGALERIAEAEPSQRAAAIAAARTVLERDTDSKLVPIRILARFGNSSPETLSALSAALEDPSSPVRAMAALALGHMGPSAKSAVPALRQALKDPANALSLDWIPIELGGLPDRTHFHGPVYPDALPIPKARRSVRFAVLKALKDIMSPSSEDADNENHPPAGGA